MKTLMHSQKYMSRINLDWDVLDILSKSLARGGLCFILFGLHFSVPLDSILRPLLPCDNAIFCWSISFHFSANTTQMYYSFRTWDPRLPLCYPHSWMKENWMLLDAHQPFTVEFRNGITGFKHLCRWHMTDMLFYVTIWPWIVFQQSYLFQLSNMTIFSLFGTLLMWR